MSFEFKFPDVGEGIQEGEIVKWLVKEGEQVKADQTIVQIETDKAVVDIPSPMSGVLLKINYREGEKVKVGAVLVVIGEKGEKVKNEAKADDKKVVRKRDEKKEDMKNSDNRGIFSPEPPMDISERSGLINRNIHKVIEIPSNLVTLQSGISNRHSRTKGDTINGNVYIKKGQSVVGQLEEASDDEDIEVEEKKHSEIMAGEKQTAKVLASPVIRKIASERKIDLTQIKGSGKEGRILMSDIEIPSNLVTLQSGISNRHSRTKGDTNGNVYIKVSSANKEFPQQTMITGNSGNNGIFSPESPIDISERSGLINRNIHIKKKYDDYGYLERVPLKGIRKTIADHMSLAWKEAPQVTTMGDIDVSELWKLREKEKKNAEKLGIKLTFLPFIIKAVIASLKENPILNSSIEGDEIIIKKYFNIGIATETDAGLMVPVVKIAQNKSIFDIAKEIGELTDKARKRTIDIMDLRGGTFTITNYGGVGGNYATPILNYPEAAILGMGRIFDRVVLNRKGKLNNVKILPVSVTFDHRIIDGGQAARFLESLNMFLEDARNLPLK